MQIALPPKLIPVFTGEADVRGARGGRGSGKTRSFATMAAVTAYRHALAGNRGIILCGRQYMNSLADSSLEEIKRAIEDNPDLRPHFEIGARYIKTANGVVEFAFAGLERSLASIKSTARILLCWVDEAEPVTDKGFEILLPTLREEDTGWNTELWLTWNPDRRTAPVERFHESTDQRVKVVDLNWRDNPKFPAILERQRQRDLLERPDSYAHVWEGDFATVHKGAYFATHLAEAEREGRIRSLEPNPMLHYKVFVDIGGTGVRADAFVMWIAQGHDTDIKVLDYYEAQGQDFNAHAMWLRDHGYVPGVTDIFLPHDGRTQDKIYAASYESAFEKAGYSVTVVPNQGRGAARMRVDALRRLFPRLIFDGRTKPGREALGWYHEKWDDNRNIGLGPEHDWSSHAADAAGLMAVVLLGDYSTAARAPAIALRRRGSAMAV